MFFRRQTPHDASFEERVDALKKAGFNVDRQAGRVRVTRGECAADVTESGRLDDRAGIPMGVEIGVLVDGGFQKFFLTPSGRKTPATADHLKALHEFEADLSGALGRKSLYNQGLGTVSALYQYDRVKDRDRGVPKRAWE
jgi:hypothetical protein